MKNNRLSDYARDNPEVLALAVFALLVVVRNAGAQPQFGIYFHSSPLGAGSVVEQTVCALGDVLQQVMLRAVSVLGSAVPR